jgi:putative pyruvate formate lyase activating enzyme
MNKFPGYLSLLQNNKFVQKIKIAKSKLKDCHICPRNCRVNRLEQDTGDCQTAYHPVVSSYFPHFGEESPLVGHRGSGTIFIAGCNLQCLFCQNYETSHFLEGKSVSIQKFASMMLELQDSGCHNINIVTPSHIVPQLIEAVGIAAENGLHIPIVYNSSGYDSMSSLKLLTGVVDIYMPDFKFFDDRLAFRYTSVKNYGKVAKKAIQEMHRQVGDLVMENGIAKRGLLIRHLVMPGLLDDSRKIFKYIAEQISENTYLNIMPQYHPAGEAHRHEEIARSVSYSEFKSAIEIAGEYGLARLDKNS